MKATAIAKNIRTTPRKARLIADFVRGKEVSKALLELKFVNKKASRFFVDIIKSAQANAKDKSLEGDLYIEEIRVDEGKKLKRFRAGSMGRALPIKRRLSHIMITLTTK